MSAASFLLTTLTGSLATGRTNNRCVDLVIPGSGVQMPTTLLRQRFVLANTEELHIQIERMTRRIRELENGLGAVYSTISNERHPLLSGEDTSTQSSSSVDVPMLASPSLPVEPDPSAYEDDVINWFGA